LQDPYSFPFPSSLQSFINTAQSLTLPQSVEKYWETERGFEKGKFDQQLMAGITPKKLYEVNKRWDWFVVKTKLTII
jgi:hypothetical protein